MSSSEVERFVSDLKTDDGLRSTLAEHASGVGSVVSFANEKGYDITVEEAGAYIQAQVSNELSDDQLDAIAGGKGSHISNDPRAQRPVTGKQGDDDHFVVAAAVIVVN
jgi:predicted ribosomally synthesized peptide with nif11-like leader